MSESTLVTAKDAAHWLQPTGMVEEVDTHIERFVEAPNRAAHMIITMILIARCADTPQRLDEVYYAVRDWSEAVAGEHALKPRPHSTIVESAQAARAR